MKAAVLNDWVSIGVACAFQLVNFLWATTADLCIVNVDSSSREPSFVARQTGGLEGVLVIAGQLQHLHCPSCILCCNPVPAMC